MGKTSERKLFRTELQTKGGVQRKDPGDRDRVSATGGSEERIGNEGLIVNGWVALKHPKMYVGMEKREGVCACV